MCEASRSGGSWSDTSEEEEEEEEELFSRTILQSCQDIDASPDVGENQENGRPSPGLAEPTIVPASHRHQIHSVIMHLQDGHRYPHHAHIGI